MKYLFSTILFLYARSFFSQEIFSEKLKNSMIAELKSGDSMVFYQCHVEEVSQQLSTAAGQTLNTNPQKYSITEKIVIYRAENNYKAVQYVSSMIIMPNRKFSGLKIREKDYWNFKKVEELQLSEKSLKLLAAIELKGKEPNEYGFAIDKYNPNQLIIRQRKNFRQLNIEGNYLVSNLVKE